MSKITPILTEKSSVLAKNGFYSFWVLPGFNKFEIKKMIEETFSVHVVKVLTANKKKIVKRNTRGHFVTKSKAKKVVVKLKEKEKIDIFEQ